MGTKTVSLADDAYERLKAQKRKGESFSDVVRRLTEGSDIERFYGILDDEAADELEEAIEEARRQDDEEAEGRAREIVDRLE